MADFSKWKQDELTVVNLRLDPLNPRIPEASTELSQRALMVELVAHDRVYELAKDIVDKGYYPIERLIVVKENGKSFVVEGNRRLAAYSGEDEHRFRRNVNSQFLNALPDCFFTLSVHLLSSMSGFFILINRYVLNGNHLSIAARFGGPERN